MLTKFFAKVIKKLSLTLLVLRIFLVNYIKATFATHNFAVRGTLLD